MKTLVLIVCALVLASCEMVEKPVGVGSDRDEFAKSPCACGPVFYRAGERV